MNRFSLIASVVMALSMCATSVAAQEPETVLELFLSIIDDTTCGDGIGRTYRSATLFSAARNDDAVGFFNRHEACAGLTDRAEQAGATAIPLGIIARCSAPVELPGLQYEWVICNLGFTPNGTIATPVRIEIAEFSIMTKEDEKIAPYTSPDLYVGQIDDMSAGLVVTGPEPASGIVAFPAYVGQIEPPYAVGWERAGNFIIADELEPEVAEHFIRDMQID